MAVISANTASITFPIVTRAFGRSFTSRRETLAILFFRPATPASACISVTTAISRKGPESSDSTARKSSTTLQQPSPAFPNTCGSSSNPPTPLPTPISSPPSTALAPSIPGRSANSTARAISAIPAEKSSPRPAATRTNCSSPTSTSMKSRKSATPGSFTATAGRNPTAKSRALAPRRPLKRQTDLCCAPSIGLSGICWRTWVNLLDERNSQSCPSRGNHSRQRALQQGSRSRRQRAPPLAHLQLRRLMDFHEREHPHLHARQRHDCWRDELEAGPLYCLSRQRAGINSHAAQCARRRALRHPLSGFCPRILWRSRRQCSRDPARPGRLRLVRHSNLDRRRSHQCHDRGSGAGLGPLSLRPGCLLYFFLASERAGDCARYRNHSFPPGHLRSFSFAHRIRFVALGAEKSRRLRPHAGDALEIPNLRRISPLLCSFAYRCGRILGHRLAEHSGFHALRPQPARSNRRPGAWPPRHHDVLLLHWHRRHFRHSDHFWRSSLESRRGPRAPCHSLGRRPRHDCAADGHAQRQRRRQCRLPG